VLGRCSWDVREEGVLLALDLSKTDLRGAYFGAAELRWAFLRNAHLEQAYLVDAHLEQANLAEAHLEGADLEGTRLDDAILWKTNLKGAKNLTVKQLSTARTLYEAQLDPPLLAQIEQQYPRLRENPED
jgi:BTB/POZ domain-containing protein KCTD9